MAQVPTTRLKNQPFLEDVARDLERLHSSPDRLQRIGVDDYYEPQASFGALDFVAKRLEQDLAALGVRR